MMNNKKYNFLESNGIQLIIIIFMVIGINPGYSQDEVQSDTTEQAEDSTIQYITPLEYAFMMHEETSWLFKVSTLLNYQYTGRLYLKIGIEKRIAPSFTLNLSVDQPHHQNLVGEYSFSDGIKTSLESRWYYRMNKRVKENKVARNMSDNYFALGMDYIRIFKDDDDFWEFTDYNYLTLYVKWGLQRRFLKHGHADVGVKLGATNTIGNFFSLPPTLVFATYVDLGFAFTKDKYKLNKDKLCPVMKCYESTNHIFKSNIGSLFGINLQRQLFSFHIAPHLAFERKIGNSPFSINTELQAVYSYSKLTGNNNEVIRSQRWWRTELSLEGRWYYNLKHRILKGKTGNGLSANYIAIGGSYKYYEESYFDHGYFLPDIYVSTGWQRVFGKHFYFDINVGFEYNFEVLNSHGGNVQSSGFEPRFRIAVGYRF